MRQMGIEMAESKGCIGRIAINTINKMLIKIDKTLIKIDKI